MTTCCMPNLKLALLSRTFNYDYLLRAQFEVVTVEQQP